MITKMSKLFFFADIKAFKAKFKEESIDPFSGKK